jgi:hypothetical protein
MSTPKELAMELYVKQLNTKLNVSDVNMDLLNKIMTRLGVAAYDTTIDAALVSGKDQVEIDRVIKNLLVKELGLDFEAVEDNNAIVMAAVEKYGISNPLKYRVPLYYVIITDLGMADHYMG